MTSYTSRIERVTDDSTRYERSDGSTTSEPVLRINMAWLPQYAADTLRFLLTRRVDTNPPHVPATFSKELLQRLSRIVIECANRRGEQCLVRLPPDIDDGYLQLNDLFHRMGFWTCVADLGRFDGQPPYWPEGADRTIPGDVLAEMETALGLIASAGGTTDGTELRTTPICRHSPDFRSISWNGVVFQFTKNQAPVVQMLWDAYFNKTPEVGGQTLLETAYGDEVVRTPSSMRVLFRDSPAWDTLIIQGDTKDAYRLADPEGFD